MKRLFLLLAVAYSLTALALPADYVWTSPSRNSSESMPCGGGSVGLNVWVERGQVLFYLSRSGCFDENNTLLKLGRFRVSLSQPLDTTRFRQTLSLADGHVTVSDGRLAVTLWADVWKPVVHVEVTSADGPVSVEATYESWRTRDRLIASRERFQTSYKFAAPRGLVTRRDSVEAGERGLVFFHQNAEQTVFDATVSQQGLDSVKARLYNPLDGLVFGGRMSGSGFRYDKKVAGRYASTDYEGWTYRSAKPRRRHELTVALANRQGPLADWRRQLDETERAVDSRRDRRASRQWWHDFWERSYIEADAPADAAPLCRNYTLFRYMLGCNAHGEWPTKFNGGLFTFDPQYVNPADEYRLSPDFRNWGGGVHTAQNQRLVYWPLLKTGDTDALRPQIDFYRRLLPTAELRSRVYWGHDGACFTEQMENYGLPCYPEYGTRRPADFDPGMERNAWLEYEWDTALEFALMELQALGTDTLARSVLLFFDQHYQYLAQRRGAKTLDDRGHLIVYPGSGGETFKLAYNPSSTVAGLRAVTEALLRHLTDSALIAQYTELLNRIPDVPVRDGRIQPAELWARVQNVETTQLYPVFPWRLYGVGRPDLDVARRTYQEDSLAVKFRSHVGWKQDNIWAACLGLTDEAARLAQLKLADGPYRFPAFWGPGFDWSPDHNWGGSAMIGLQEMLLQEDASGRLHLFPAWPRQWDVRFRLQASGGCVVEAELRGGEIIRLSVTPRERLADIVSTVPRKI